MQVTDSPGCVFNFQSLVAPFKTRQTSSSVRVVLRIVEGKKI